MLSHRRSLDQKLLSLKSKIVSIDRDLQLLAYCLLRINIRLTPRGYDLRYTLGAKKKLKKILFIQIFGILWWLFNVLI